MIKAICFKYFDSSYHRTCFNSKNFKLGLKVAALEGDCYKYWSYAAAIVVIAKTKQAFAQPTCNSTPLLEYYWSERPRLLNSSTAIASSDFVAKASSTTTIEEEDSVLTAEARFTSQAEEPDSLNFSISSLG